MNAARIPRRPRAQVGGRNLEIAKIHIGATDRRLIVKGDDASYRIMLREVAGVSSAKDLSADGRAKVLEHLRALGWEDTHQASPKRREGGTPQVRLIRHLWTTLHKAGHVENGSDAALRAFVEHWSKPYHPDKVGYSSPDLLPKHVAGRVIEHLKKWCDRTGTEWQQ